MSDNFDYPDNQEDISELDKIKAVFEAFSNKTENASTNNAAAAPADNSPDESTEGCASPDERAEIEEALDEAEADEDAVYSSSFAAELPENEYLGDEKAADNKYTENTLDENEFEDVEPEIEELEDVEPEVVELEGVEPEDEEIEGVEPEDEEIEDEEIEDVEPEDEEIEDVELEDEEIEGVEPEDEEIEDVEPEDEEIDDVEPEDEEPVENNEGCASPSELDEISAALDAAESEDGDGEPAAADEETDGDKVPADVSAEDEKPGETDSEEFTDELPEIEYPEVLSLNKFKFHTVQELSDYLKSLYSNSRIRKKKFPEACSALIDSNGILSEDFENWLIGQGYSEKLNEWKDMNDELL